MHGSRSNESNQFGFGIEAEYLLVDKDMRPLFAEDLDFEVLRDCVDEISACDLGIAGFNIKPLHRVANPYLIEGYYLTDSEMKPWTLLAKGIEVRTPVRSTIDEAVNVLADATERLRLQVFREFGYYLCSISHHPTKSKFQAPPNYKRHDYWQWALTAMTTFGPDINISVPECLSAQIDQEQLGSKINAYMPALVALTFASPLYEGALWHHDGAYGKSVRTYHRSAWAPLYYVHTEPSLRFEFKGFEMPAEFSDYSALFLVCLALLLDDTLTERATDEERVAELRYLAVHGLHTEAADRRARTLLESAKQTAMRLSFDHACLKTLWRRLDLGVTPADDIARAFLDGNSISQALQTRVLKPLAGPITLDRAPVHLAS